MENDSRQVQKDCSVDSLLDRQQEIELAVAFAKVAVNNGIKSDFLQSIPQDQNGVSTGVDLGHSFVRAFVTATPQNSDPALIERLKKAFVTAYHRDIITLGGTRLTPSAQGTEIPERVLGDEFIRAFVTRPTDGANAISPDFDSQTNPVQGRTPLINPRSKRELTDAFITAFVRKNQPRRTSLTEQLQANATNMVGTRDTPSTSPEKGWAQFLTDALSNQMLIPLQGDELALLIGKLELEAVVSDNP